MVAVCVVVAGCGGSTTPGDLPASDIPTSEVSGLPAPTPEGQQPAPETRNDPRQNPDPPGVPGSPIDYDSTLLSAPGGITPAGAKTSIEGELESKCEVNRCGVKVVIKGRGACAVAIGPDPVSPGQTITIVTGRCPSVEEPPVSDSVTPTTEEITPTSRG
jgi:hypothetical protein